MDVCPVEALDMSRPAVRRASRRLGSGRPLPWMMESPVQVGECIGCSICVDECPVSVMTLADAAGPTRSRRARARSIARPQRPDGWVPLSEWPARSSSPTIMSPWGDLFSGWTRSRPGRARSGTSMVDERQPTPSAPCQAACPAGTDAGRYVGLMAQGRYDDAYAVAAEVNPFPSVCGWICTAPCEAACRRGALDEPIAIRTLKRFAAEHGTLPAVDPPADAALGTGRHRRRRPGRHVGGVLPGSAGLSRSRSSRRCRCPAA